MSSINIPSPGIPKDEFIETHGPEAYTQLDHRYIVSWNHEAYVLDGWDGAE